MPDVFVDMADQDPDIPKIGDEDCPHDPKIWETGYGLAGGGIGVYMYCPKCEKVVSKDQDKNDE